MNKIFAFIGLFSLVMNLNAQSKAPGSDSIDVISYTIYIDTVDISGQQLYGHAILNIQPRVGSLQVVPLDLLSLTVDSVFVNGTNVSTYSHNDTLLAINCPVPLSGTDTSEIHVYYHGHAVIDPSTWGGFYFSNPYAYNLGVGFESEPHNFGRVWFPCIDDFTDKAFYEYFITTDTSQMAVCGGMLTDTVVQPSANRIIWHWEQAEPIPTYLASMAIGPYVCVSDTFTGLHGTIPIDIYVPQSIASKVPGSFGNLPDVLAIYENRFGAYRWERVGYVGVPFNSGAMEHATNIAYPNVAITGSLTYESLTAHELSHHWFGNLVTCSTANEMWLNEGWAVFCEFIHQEGLYGSAAMTDYIRNTLAGVLKNAHYTDGGFYPVGNVPSSLTYSTTVYEKGGLMVHTLRYYMGDTLFFPAVRHYFDSLAYGNATIAQMRDIFESHSGLELNDFFDAWIYREGFPHFSTDSMKVVPAGAGQFDVTVFLKQKLFGTSQFANSNRIELLFMDSLWNEYRTTAVFDGQSGSNNFTLPFAPIVVITDPDEKTADAVISYNQKIKDSNTYSFGLSYCTVDITNYTDSIFLRVEHHKVAPDAVKSNPLIYRISPNRYWSISGIVPSGTEFSAQFDYNKSTSASTGYLDSDLLTTATSGDSLILVYRRDASKDWEITPFTKIGNNTVGKVKALNGLPGEYALAIGEPFQAGLDQPSSGQMNVYPNPAIDEVRIETSGITSGTVYIYSSDGKMVFSEQISSPGQTLIWNCSHLASGLYHVQMIDSKGKSVMQKEVTLIGN